MTIFWAIFGIKFFLNYIEQYFLFPILSAFYFIFKKYYFFSVMFYDEIEKKGVFSMPYFLCYLFSYLKTFFFKLHFFHVL